MSRKGFGLMERMRHLLKSGALRPPLWYAAAQRCVLPPRPPPPPAVAGAAADLDGGRVSRVGGRPSAQIGLQLGVEAASNPLDPALPSVLPESESNFSPLHTLRV